MCDYSLQSIRSRPAKVGDVLTTRDFGTGTRGFAAAEDSAVAVCVLPGTELAFASAVTIERFRCALLRHLEDANTRSHDCNLSPGKQARTAGAP